MTALVLVCLWTGILLFGAVRPWAYVPMLSAAALIGGWLIVVERKRATRLSPTSIRLLVAAFVVVMGASFQLVPLPTVWLVRISPSTITLLEQLDLSFAALPPPHSLSISPRATVRFLFAWCALALWLVGVRANLTADNTLALLRGLCALALVVATIGIVQRPLYDGLMYGLWKPNQPSEPFGPFVNRNHFGGFAAMVLPSVIAYAIVTAVRARARVQGRFWMTTSDAAEAAFAAFSALVLVTSIGLSTSRSGLVAAAFGLVMFVMFGRRHATKRQAPITLAFVAVVLTAGVAWAGLGAIEQRFGTGEWKTLGGRLGAWTDAAAIFGQFWVAGTGMNTYGIATLFYQRHDLGVHYAQAHNDYLQVLAEGGIIVAGGFLLSVVVLLNEARRALVRSAERTVVKWARVGGTAGCLAVAGQETVDFSLQMPGNALLCALLLAMLLQPEAPGMPRSSPQP